MVRVGCAGWALEKRHQSRFPDAGTHLQRYAAVFSCVEINSSFYRPHKPETYRRWAESVPESFRFSVKVPKEITHELRLRDCFLSVDRFLSEVLNLGGKIGPLMIQLPPSERFDAKVAEVFFIGLRERFSGLVTCEPRHASWFANDADILLRDLRVARAAADPAMVQDAARPSGWPGLVYYRLHGSPKLYYSEYSEQGLSHLASALIAEGESEERYCIFDNTAAGHAIPDALMLNTLLKR